MAEVRLNESSLVDIADAIREKNLKTDTYKPSEMGEAIRSIKTTLPVTEPITITANGVYTSTDDIDGYSPVTVDVQPNNTTIEITSNGTYTPDGYDGFSEVTVNTLMPTAEELVLTGDLSYAFSYGKWDWFIEKYGDLITTKDITNASQLFAQSNVTEIPFDLNFKINSSHNATALLFNGCGNLISVPTISNCKTSELSHTFSACKMLRTIPEDIESWFDWTYMDTLTSAYNGNRGYTFNGCYSLRSFPMGFLNHGNPVSSDSYSIYYSLFQNCYALDEIIDLPNPHSNVTWTSNVFGTTFRSCGRVKNITFAMPDGQPYSVKWKGQIIDLSSNTGYMPNTSYFLNYNSGITADKQVSNPTQYEALKNDPDWFTCATAYSRYNHDSAVATINSLPDTSAYLATAGGTNTIKFKGEAGSATDGGAINTLTEEEIAVAAAKGWTVVFIP